MNLNTILMMFFQESIIEYLYSCSEFVLINDKSVKYSCSNDQEIV